MFIAKLANLRPGRLRRYKYHTYFYDIGVNGKPNLDTNYLLQTSDTISTEWI